MTRIMGLLEEYVYLPLVPKFPQFHQLDKADIIKNSIQSCQDWSGWPEVGMR